VITLALEAYKQGRGQDMNVELLRDSLKRAKTENGGLDALGMKFYGRLFEKYPGVKPLFHTPPEEQQKKLMASLGAIVGSVEAPAKLLPYLHAMGMRHIRYKTEDAHYPAVSENLIAVLKEHLSKEGEWTKELEETWEKALITVSTVMMEAANRPELFREELRIAGYDEHGFRQTKTPTSDESDEKSQPALTTGAKN
jgi:hemoglobin-like flavoprotein